MVTAAELIAVLSKLPPETPILIDDGFTERKGDHHVDKASLVGDCMHTSFCLPEGKQGFFLFLED